MEKKDNQKDGFLQMLDNMKEMLKGMSDKQLIEMENIFSGMFNLADKENKIFYRYKKPDYASKATKDSLWFGPFWNAKNEDDKKMLCNYIESSIADVSPELLSEEIRGYIYHLLDSFTPGYQNHWRLYGPLWIMEKHQMNDCLDLVLEVLRQDAHFYNNYFQGFVEWPSALVYQLGKDQIDTLEKFLYEQGIIPYVKPIVFNALVWIYLRHPEKRLRIASLIVTFLRHCLDICLKGASTINIEHYVLSCATAHIQETLPIIHQLFSELDITCFLITDGVKEVDKLMNIIKIPFYCRYDNFNAYLYDTEELNVLEDADWQYSDEDSYVEDSLYDESYPAKRYIIRVELLDAPEKVERTVQVPSNIYLDAFTELLMLSFDRQDVPEHYEYSDGHNRFLSDVDDYSNDADSWEMEDTSYSLLGDLLGKNGDSATFSIKKGKDTIWKHVLTLDKSGRYTPKIENRIELISGQGCYPVKSVKSMEAHIARYNNGKLKQPNFDKIRQLLLEFE